MIFLILPVGKHVLWDRFGGIACLILRPSSVSVYSPQALVSVCLPLDLNFFSSFFFSLTATWLASYRMGCGASTNVQARLDYITTLEAEVQDLKAQRSEALQRITVTDSEKENVAMQSLRNRSYAKNARKEATITEQTAAVEKAYLEAQHARSKANEEAVLHELKHVKTELHFLKLEFNSAKLQHTAFVKHLERDIMTLEKEKVYTTKTMIENYEVVLYQQISKYRDLMQDIIDFMGHIVDLADGLKVKQIRLDTQVEIERREDVLAAYNKVPLEDYVKQAKEFLLLDPMLKNVALGKLENEKTPEQIQKEREEEAERKLEEEARKQLEAEKLARDRDERARVRRLAEDAPRLEKELAQLKEDYKVLRKDNDDLKVMLAKLQVGQINIPPHSCTVLGLHYGIFLHCISKIGL